MARIMVVDDDDALRKALSRLLVADGHEVLQEPDGKAALRHFAGDPVDVVISDVYMPDMDGLEFLRRVREAFPEARVVVMSGGGYLPADDVLAASIALGAKRVLQKPFSPDEVREAITGALGNDATGDLPG